MKEVLVAAYRTRMEIGVARRELDSLIPKLQPLSLPPPYCHPPVELKREDGS
jgi:hypothetical protein